jgi:hydrogenase maturation protease
VDLIEALTLCHALDHVPRTTIIGIEPKDLNTLGEDLTPEIESRLDGLTDLVLDEVKRLGGTYSLKAS